MIFCSALPFVSIVFLNLLLLTLDDGAKSKQVESSEEELE